MKTNEMFNLKSSQAHKGELIDSSRTSSVNVSINYLNAKFTERIGSEMAQYQGRSIVVVPYRILVARMDETRDVFRIDAIRLLLIGIAITY